MLEKVYYTVMLTLLSDDALKQLYIADLWLHDITSRTKRKHKSRQSKVLNVELILLPILKHSVVEPIETDLKHVKSTLNTL
jgi:hypothetical protein